MKLKIGTRQSNLARAQTQLVIRRLKKLTPGLEVEMFPMSSTGDRTRDQLDQKVSDKKEWIIDLEEALLEGIVDVAIHSGKDVPYDLAEGTVLTSVLERAAPGDVFIGRRVGDGEETRRALSEVVERGTIGTSSLRRAALLKSLYSGVSIKEIRGNVETRLRKLDDSDDFDGTILAESGLERIGLEGLHFERFDLCSFVPAVNQGILAAQYLKERGEVAEVLSCAVDSEVQSVFIAERACIEVLQADCNSMVGVYGEVVSAGELKLSGIVLGEAGERIESSQSGDAGEARALGSELARDLLRGGAARLLAVQDG